MHSKQSSEPTADQVVRAAVGAAGGVSKVASGFGLSAAAVSGWLDRARVPVEKITRLCAMGGNAIRPEQILEAIERDALGKAA